MGYCLKLSDIRPRDCLWTSAASTTFVTLAVALSLIPTLTLALTLVDDDVCRILSERRVSRQLRLVVGGRNDVSSLRSNERRQVRETRLRVCRLWKRCTQYHRPTV